MRLKRLAVDDERLVDGELVVLTHGTVLVLSEVASAALHRLSTEVWTTLEALTAALASSVGLPPEGEAAVFSLVSTLVDAGLATAEE
jgi:hypothetical protein